MRQTAPRSSQRLSRAGEDPHAGVGSPAARATAGDALPGPGQLRWSLRVRRRLTAVRRGLRRSTQPDRRPIATSAGARVALVATTLAYVCYLSYLTVRNHSGFGTFGFDLGIFDQGLWLLSRWDTPFVTVRGLHLFGDHTSFVLLGFVPLYWVAASPVVLLVGQSLALGAGAVPTFLIARQKLRSEWLAFGCALAYLAHPAVAWTNFENFHPDALEVPLVLLAFLFVSARRWWWFAAAVAALLLVKEDVPLLTFALGVYVAVRHHRAIGLATAALSAAWFAFSLFVVLPAFNEVGTLYAGRLPSDQFGGLGGLVTAAVTRPWEVAALALGPEQRWYLWQLLASFALLPLLAPGIVLVAAGPLLSNLLSTFWYPYQLEYHYSTLIVPVLTVSAIVGVARFRSLRVRGTLTTVMAGAAVVAAFLWGPLGRHPGHVADPNSPQARAARQAIAMIPPDAAVSAWHHYVPHLTHREHIYEFPNPWRAANWGDWAQEGSPLPFTDEIQYLLVPASALDDPGSGRIIAHLEQTEFERSFESGGVLLFVRDHPRGEGR